MKRNFKHNLYEIIFESDTPASRNFDLALLVLILFSVLIVIIESVSGIRGSFGKELYYAEWILTTVFTLEYILRIYASRKTVNYIFSFYGIIDLLAILPAYLGLFIAGTHSLLIIRAFRLLRVFRILKLNRYFSAGQLLLEALKQSRAKIGVFLFAVITIVILLGTVIYLIEGEANGFRNIPVSIYWAIVTLTTVGYGDLTPQTMLGQVVSGVLMIMGYAIIAVPTGIISVEMGKQKAALVVCPQCGNMDNDKDAGYCKKCGGKLGST